MIISDILNIYKDVYHFKNRYTLCLFIKVHVLQSMQFLLLFSSLALLHCTHIHLSSASYSLLYVTVALSHTFSFYGGF